MGNCRWLRLAGRGLVKPPYPIPPLRNYLVGKSQHVRRGGAREGRQGSLDQPSVYFLSFSFIGQELTSQRPESPSFWFAFPVLIMTEIGSKIRFTANKNENNVALNSFQENQKEMNVDLISVLSSLSDYLRWFTNFPSPQKGLPDIASLNNISGIFA